jgi:addiction module HigA family antidote
MRTRLVECGAPDAALAFTAMMRPRNRRVYNSFMNVGRRAMPRQSRSPTITKRAAAREYAGDFAIAVHPGDILQEMLEERGASQSDLARRLRTDVARINEICRRRRGVSAQMAVLLGRAFGTSPGLWLNLQKNWELSQVDPRSVRRIHPLPARR